MELTPGELITLGRKNGKTRTTYAMIDPEGAARFAMLERMHDEGCKLSNEEGFLVLTWAYGMTKGKLCEQCLQREGCKAKEFANPPRSQDA